MPIVVLSLIEQILRLVNNIIEAQPMEQRRSEALIAWRVVKPLLWTFLPDDTKAELDQLEDNPTP